MRILGLDYGDSRIGVAVSDALGVMAQPVTVISENNMGAQTNRILEQIKLLKPEKIVVGMPYNMNGTIGERGEKTHEFVNALAKKTSVSIELWDERLTTASAHRVLENCGVSGKKRKGLLDKIAAVFILQGYLDSRAN